MFEDWAALVVLPAMGLGFASSYLWLMLRPSLVDEDVTEIDEQWRAAARLLDGIMRSPVDRLSPSIPPAIDADIAGVSVTVEARAWREWAYSHNAMEYANRFQTIILARADCHDDMQLSFTIEESFEETAPGEVSAQYLITGLSDRLSEAWVSQDFLHHAEQAGGYLYALDRGRVVAVTDRLELSPERLAAATRAVAALAGRGAELYDGWEQAARRLGGTIKARRRTWEPNGRTRLSLEHGGVPTFVDSSLETVPGDDVPHDIFTRVRARVTGDTALVFALHGHRVPKFARYFTRVLDFDEELSKRYILRSPSPSEAAQRFDPELSRVITALGPYDITRENDWVTVRMRGLVGSSSVLEMAVNVATSLARASKSTPYR